MNRQTALLSRSDRATLGKRFLAGRLRNRLAPRVWPRFEANENENAPRDVTGAEVVAFKLCGSVGVSPREVRVAVVNGSAGEVPRRTIVVVRETIVAVQRTALEARSIMVLVRVATHLVLASLGIVIVDL